MDTELERKWTGVQDSLAARYPHSMHSRIFTSDAHLLAIDKDRAVIAVPNKGSILVGQKAERAVLAELKNWGMQTTRIEYEILVCFL